MALNKSEFATRTITGLIIGAVTIGAIVISPYTFLGWCCLITIFSIREYMTLEKMEDTLLNMIVIPLCLAGAVGLTGLSLIWQWPLMMSLSFLPFTICLVASIQLLNTSDVEMIVFRVKTMLQAVSYIVLSMISACCFLFEGYDWPYVLLPILLIWVNDIMAYLIGSKWGQRKIAPAISPGKSIEGTIGAAALTIITGFGFTMIWTDMPMYYPIILGLLVPVFALAGDLWESALKRQAGVKDSGTILPGHGGFLDRYDSLLFVFPVAALAYFIFAS